MSRGSVRRAREDDGDDNASMSQQHVKGPVNVNAMMTESDVSRVRRGQGKCGGLEL